MWSPWCWIVLRPAAGSGRLDLRNGRCDHAARGVGPIRVRLPFLRFQGVIMTEPDESPAAEPVEAADVDAAEPVAVEE